MAYLDAVTKLGPGGSPRAPSYPGIGGVDGLLANDVESASEVSTPALAQVHAILADDVQSTSEVSTPAVGQEHGLLANDVESASEVTQPALTSGSDALLANDVESASEVSVPALTQVHGLAANDVESASEVSAPRLDAELEGDEEQPSGGYGALNAYDAYRQLKRQRERERKRLQRLLEEIESDTDRQIAQMLHSDTLGTEQELVELEAMVNRTFSPASVAQINEYSERVADAYKRAYRQGNYSAMKAFEREMERALEEEEFMMLTIAALS